MTARLILGRQRQRIERRAVIRGGDGRDVRCQHGAEAFRCVPGQLAGQDVYGHHGHAGPLATVVKGPRQWVVGEDRLARLGGLEGTL